MPKIVDHDQYRKELLTKCFDLFAEKGYGSITMRQIAKELGVSTGTLYHYFPSKKDLFWQLYEEMTEQDEVSIRALIQPDLPLKEKINLIFEFLAQSEDYFFKQTLITFDFYQQHDREEILANERLKRSIELSLQLATELLGIQDPLLIDFVICFIAGIVTVRLLEGEVVSYTEQAALLEKMLTAYLKEGKGEP